MRAVWSGTINFGMVSVPTKLYKATDDAGGVSFRQLNSKTNNPIAQKRVDSITGEEVPYDTIVKGYEIKTNTFVKIDPDELAELLPDKTKQLEITHFVDEADIPLIHFDSPYYLGVDEAGAKPYTLLLEALKKTGRVAIGRLVMRSRESLVVLRPEGDHLTCYTMRWADDVRNPVDVNLTDFDQRELEMAVQLIENFDHDLNLHELHDEYNEKVIELIEAKSKGQTITIESPEGEDRTVDLMEALTRSIEEVKQQRATEAS